MKTPSFRPSEASTSDASQIVRRRLHCAIYTRKSSEEGLEQAFNSLDAQREACQAYILCQKHDGWIALPAFYDDGGLSGGNMERPALKRLLDDVTSGRIDIIVVYKVDRLTRSLSDFARIVDRLDKHQVSFVSVTQAFNTTSSMGRLTLNVLLSFAQFEREIAGERIRDKIAASKRKGMWMGGTVPFGYQVRDRSLLIQDDEAIIVRRIFGAYVQLKSVEALVDHLMAHDIRKTRDRKGGVSDFSRATLYHMLSNRTYIGLVNHKGESFQGLHQPIINPDLWERVQNQLTHNTNNQRGSKRLKHPSLLAGKIETADARRLIATHTVKKGIRYRYYADLQSAPTKQPSNKLQPANPVFRIPASAIERIVVDRIRSLLRTPTELAELLQRLNLSAGLLREIVHTARTHAEDWHNKSAVDQQAFLQTVLIKVRLCADHVELSLSQQGLMQAIGVNARTKTEAHGDEERIVFQVDVVVIKTENCLESTGNGIRLIIRDDIPSVANEQLAPLIAHSYSLREAVLNGAYDSIEAASKGLKLGKGYITSRIRLTYLSPILISKMFNGDVPRSLSPTKLVDASRDLPIKWSEQERFIANLAR